MCAQSALTWAKGTRQGCIREWLRGPSGSEVGRVNTIDCCTGMVHHRYFLAQRADTLRWRLENADEDVVSLSSNHDSRCSSMISSKRDSSAVMQVVVK